MEIPYKFLVVDDERLSRRYIHDLILEFLPNAIVFEADSAATALPQLQSGEINILFLDIQMPERDGFSLLQEIKNKNFELIFITAHSQYAIPAIREDAADYLLKPIKKSAFKSMLERVLKRIATSSGVPKNIVADYLDRHLALSHHQGIRLILLRDIIYLKADNSYTTFFLQGSEKFISSKPISIYEQMLDASFFFRIHKSYLINMAYFKEYQSRDGDKAVMNTGDKLQISRYRLPAFLALLKSKAAMLK